jgi:hypothetical protein
MSQLAIGVALVLAAIALIFIGRPNKAGQHPRFLQFEASLVLYPPVVLVCFAMGTAEIIFGLLGMSR